MTVSDRSFRGVRPDASGERLVELVTAAGHDVVHRAVVPDDPDALAALLRRLADGEETAPAPDLVVTTGGTGITPRDLTPEATVAACDRLVPGIAEAIRAASLAVTPMAMISRGVAGVRAGTLIVNVPGSPGGAADGWGVVAPVVAHACSQVRGGDHPPAGG